MPPQTIPLTTDSPIEYRGSAVYRQHQGRLEYAIDTLWDKCEVYKASDTKEAYRTFEVKNKKNFTCVKQVIWIEDEQLLAYGSDHGYVYIFDNDGNRKQRIQHGSRGMYNQNPYTKGLILPDEIVQTFTNAKSTTHFMLATSAMEGDGTIILWTKMRKALASKWDPIIALTASLVLLLVIRAMYEVRQSICDLKGG